MALAVLWTSLSDATKNRHNPICVESTKNAKESKVQTAFLHVNNVMYIEKVC